MKKFSIALFILLIISISGMLIWQWNVYSNVSQEDDEKKEKIIHQEITVQPKKKKLLITQQFQGLSNGDKVKLIIPDKATDWKCFTKDGDECKPSNADPFIFSVKDGSLTVKYSLKRSSKPAFLLKDWQVKILNSTITETYLKIIADKKGDGTWVSPLPLVAKEPLQYIDYYAFKGKGEGNLLYWQRSSLVHKKDKYGNTFYINGSNIKTYSLKALKDLPNFDPLTIVVTDQYKEKIEPSFMIIHGHISEKELERTLVHSYLAAKFSELESDEKWLIDVFVSLHLDEKSKYKKGNQIIKELKKNLTSEELSHLDDKVIQQKGTIKISDLDEFLSKDREQKTHFFTLNKNKKEKLVPLYYYDTRKVKINDKVQKKVQAIYLRGERLYPCMETMEALGYEVQLLPDQFTLYINKGSKRYRLFLDQKIIIINEDNYGLLKKPLTQFNGKIYMKETWLKSIFRVYIFEDEKEIVLSI